MMLFCDAGRGIVPSYYRHSGSPAILFCMQALSPAPFAPTPSHPTQHRCHHPGTGVSPIATPPPPLMTS